MVINEIHKGRILKIAALFKGRPISYIKMTNIHFIKAKEIGELCRNSSRVCLKNVVVSEISKDIIKSEAKYITMKGVSNIQNLEHTKFHECE